MFQKAKPIWIKDKSTEMNVFAVYRLKTILSKDAELHITGATFYRVFVDGKFAGFGPARTAAGYAREDVFLIKAAKPGVLSQENETSDVKEVSGKECEILIEACGYNCRGLDG